MGARGARALPTFGPYRTLGVLGQGGMGVVYRGEHRETGEQVAIKTVHVRIAANLAAIRREIHALSRLRHPGIVRVVTAGVTDGLPWYAMELVEGRVLSTHLDELWVRDQGCISTAPPPHPSDATAPLTLPPPAPGKSSPPQVTLRLRPRDLLPMLTLVRRLCAPLAFLHGSGIVHRDVKPDNILLRPDGAPVLLDLGIAARFGGLGGREELGAEGRFMGSVPYIAPEQLRGDLVDARADLYALGCTLYECVTGRPPFAGPPVAILEQHLHVAPVPPSMRVEGIPPALDELVLRLLQKRPQDRLGYAEDVAEALADLGGEAAASPTSRRAPPYVYRPELAGREGAVGELQGAVGRLSRERRGALLFVGGESGVGKTRLAMEAANFATQEGLQVVTGQCTALGIADGPGQAEIAAAPLHPLRPLLLAVADRCREHGAEEAVRLLGPRAKVLATYEPTLAELPGLDRQSEPAALSPQAAVARVLEALKATLFAFADGAPLLLVLDDLQWADELSLAFLRSLAETDLSESGVLLVGTYRMEEMREELAAVVHAPRALHLELGRLDTAAVGAMVSGMLAIGPPPADLVGFLERQSDGNPFFIAEYLRAAIAEGMVRRGRTGEWRVAGTSFGTSLPLPRTLAELIEGRLREVGNAGLALAQMAAVLGREFDGELLAATAGLGGALGPQGEPLSSTRRAADTELMEAIETLRLRQIVEEAGPGRLRFVHDKLRELTYERIPEARRRDLHLRAAEAIEHARGGHADESPALAHHFAKAEIHPKASHYFALAAEHARRAHANGDAIASFRAAIAEGRLARGEDTVVGEAPLEPLAVLYARMADILVIIGRHEEARAGYGEALADMPVDARLERSRVHRKMGETLETQHRQDEALQAYDAAELALGNEPAAGGEPWQDEWVQIQIARVSVGYWLGRVEEITALVAKVRPVVERRGSPLQRACFFRALTQLNTTSERYVPSAETVRYGRASLEASEASGDPDEGAWASFALAFVLLLHGAIDEAEERLRELLRLSEQRGNIPLQARCLAYATAIERKRARVAEVRVLAARLLEAAAATGMTVYLGAGQGHLAWVASREGNVPGVLAAGARALELWRGIPNAFPFQWIALFPLLAAKVAEGRVDEAVEHARALLDETQQRLPEELSRPLQQAVALGALEPESVRALLLSTLGPASELGFL